MSIPYPASLPEATLVMPRFWLGTPRSCNTAKNSLAFTCINVGNAGHTNDQRCRHIAILGADGLVDYNAMARIENLIFANWNAGNNYLIHCSDGLGLSPLVMALWMHNQQHIALSDAYKWLMQQKPGIQDLTKLVAPRAT